MPELKVIARPWNPQDLIDDLQLMIDEAPDLYTNSKRTTLCMARDYLKELFGIDQLPLTIDELTKMEGKPVWVQPLAAPEHGRWAIVAGVDTDNEEKTLYLEGDFTCREYGHDWIAYSRKPAGVTDNG